MDEEISYEEDDNGRYVKVYLENKPKHKESIFGVLMIIALIGASLAVTFIGAYTV